MCLLVLGDGALSFLMITVQRDLLRYVYKKDITVNVEIRRGFIKEHTTASFIGENVLNSGRQKPIQVSQADRNLVNRCHSITDLRFRFKANLARCYMGFSSFAPFGQIHI